MTAPRATSRRTRWSCAWARPRARTSPPSSARTWSRPMNGTAVSPSCAPGSTVKNGGSNGVQPYWRFDTMLSHASQSETVLPGDLLGSGTYFKGCGLDQDRWIKPGDVLELDAGPLGVLKNSIGKPAGSVRLKYGRDGRRV